MARSRTLPSAAVVEDICRQSAPADVPDVRGCTWTGTVTTVRLRELREHGAELTLIDFDVELKKLLDGDSGSSSDDR